MNTLPTSDVTIKHSSVNENTLVNVFSLQFMHTDKKKIRHSAVIIVLRIIDSEKFSIMSP